MNVNHLRDIHSGKISTPIVLSVQQSCAAQLNTDEYHRAAAIKEAHQNHTNSLRTALDQPGMSSLYRRRVLKQSFQTTKKDRRNMIIEQMKRSKLGKNRCDTCQRAKRGAARKVWVRAEHLMHAEKMLMEQDPKRFHYCDCKERLEELWHVPLHVREETFSSLFSFFFKACVYPILFHIILHFLFINQTHIFLPYLKPPPPSSTHTV